MKWIDHWISISQPLCIDETPTASLTYFTPTTYTPTPKPTIQPSNLDHSEIPIHSNSMSTTPQIKVRYGVKIILTFHYQFSSVDTQEIINILQDLANELNKGYNCDIQPRFNATIINDPNMNGNITIIDVVILVCNQDQQNQLLQAFGDTNLEHDIVQKINTKTDTQISQNTTNIDIEVSDIIFYDNHTLQIVLTTKVTTPSINVSNEDTQTLFYMILFIFFKLILCVSGNFIVFIKQNQQIKKKNADIQKRYKSKLQIIPKTNLEFYLKTRKNSIIPTN